MLSNKIAVLWPDDSNYARFVAVCSDVIKHATVDQYHAAAREKLDQLTARGVIVAYVSFVPDELASWAKKQGMPVNSQARAAYAPFLQMNSDLSKK